jgi:hypothetical protein
MAVNVTGISDSDNTEFPPRKSSPLQYSGRGGKPGFCAQQVAEGETENADFPAVNMLRISCSKT